MLITKVEVRPTYILRRDRHYTSVKYVLLRNVTWVIEGYETRSTDLDKVPLTVLGDSWICYANSYETNSLNPFIIPSLTSAAETLYARTPVIEGCDTITLPASLYEWKRVKSWRLYNEDQEQWYTHYCISGRWDKYQGVIHSLDRRV